MKKNRMTSGRATIIAILISTGCWVPHPEFAFAQTSSGAAFLKVLPGSRQQGMAATATGVLDDMQSIYANPAAAGFLREWQWSTNYNEWIADSYQLALAHSRRLRLPWSHRSQIAVGLQYQGVREFDSTNRNQPAASASDVLFSLSYGNPVRLFKKDFAFGGSIKYLRSELANFSARTWAFDVGVLYRSERREIKLPFFKYAIFSAGAALTNMGKGLTFINTSTPLPRIFTTGVSANFGAHGGLQMQLSADLKKPRGERASLSFGTEVAWNYRLALRGGYTLNNRLLNKFTFGLSFRLDDHASPLHSLPGKDKALRVDFAGVDRTEILGATYQAGAHYFPTRPEAFLLISPLGGVNLGSNEFELVWTPAHDPDLFDDIRYFLFVEKTSSSASDSLRLESLTQMNGQVNFDHFPKNGASYFARDITEIVKHDACRVRFQPKDLTPGEYVWTVAAVDQDGHIRFGSDKSGHFGNFSILPDLQLTKFDFTPSPWITDSDDQGELTIKLANQGKASAENFEIVIFDSLASASKASEKTRLHPRPESNGMMFASKVIGRNDLANERIPIFKVTIAKLGVDRDTTFVIPWRTNTAGLHNLDVQLDPENHLLEFNEQNNTKQDNFYTIPHGHVATSKKVITQVDSLYEYELPFIPRIYFEHGSAEIKGFGSSLIYFPLKILAQRLKVDSELNLQLRGFVDLENGESEGLAGERASIVKQALLEQGVAENRIEIQKDLRPVADFGGSAGDGTDAAWVGEEKRFVKITVIEKQSGHENVRLFSSVSVQLPKSETFHPVTFESNLDGFVPLKSGRLIVHSDTLVQNNFDINFTAGTMKTLTWELDEKQRLELKNQVVSYEVIVEDVNGRTFKTRSQEALLAVQKRNLLDQKIIIGVAEFRQERPQSNLNWASVASKLEDRLRNENIHHLNFVGHACAIGDSAYNFNLSRTRAQNFYTEFSERYPNLILELRTQGEEIGAVGRGENQSYNMVVDRTLFLSTLRQNNADEFNKITYELVSGKKYNPNFPFTFKLQGENILIEGDNRTPYGRQINRRIEILIESEE